MKINITVHIEQKVVERLRNTVYWTPGQTVSSLVEKSIDEYLLGLEEEHGGPFEKRNNNLKVGRKISYE